MILLFVMLLAAPVQALAAQSMTAVIPFAVEYAPATVVLEAIDGAPMPETSEFTGVSSGAFEITYNDPGNYYYTVRQTGGTDENIQYDDTVYDVAVSILVNEGTGDWYAIVVISIDGDAHKPDSIAFDNIHLTGDLRISKTVTGNAGDKDRDWHFTILFSEGVNGFYGDVRFTDGVSHISLKHGEEVLIKGLPAGATYSVAEDEANTDGYTTACEGIDGYIVKYEVASASFVNEKNVSLLPQTGDTTQLILWIVLGGASLAGILWVILGRRKNGKDTDSDS